MNYAVVGPGRMGRAIAEIADGRGHRCVATIGRCDSLDAAAGGGAEVAFEFTCPESAASNVAELLESGVSVVCGTTGWTPGQRVTRALSAREVGLLVSPNFSTGVQLFFRMVRAVTELLAASGGYQPYVLEAHHRGKRDAPSGTAERIASIMLDADPRLNRRAGGEPGPLPDERTLQLASLRVGAEPGMHEVGFDGEHDRITLRHAARGRSGFAGGAVLAAEWLHGRSGRFEIDAMLDTLMAEAGLERRGDTE